MTSEVRLRPVERDDLPMIDEWDRLVPEVDEFNDFGFRRPARNAKSFEENGFLGDESGTLLVTLSDGTVIGDVSYRRVRYGGPPSDAFNIGVSLRPEHRGRGYGALAQAALVDYLFATTSANRVEASTDVENLAERGSLRKAGFTEEGVLRGAQFRRGAFHDLVLFSRLRSDPAPKGRAEVT